MKFILVSLLLVSVPVFAASRDTKAVEELFKVTHVEEINHKMIKQMVDNQIKENQSMEAYRDILTDFYKRTAGWNVIKPQLTSIYQEYFTDDELKDLAQVYRTPIFQKYTDHQAEIATRSMSIFTKSLQDHMTELNQAIEKRKLEIQKKK